MSIQNSSCDTSKWLIVDFMLPKEWLFLAQNASQAFDGRAQPELMVERYELPRPIGVYDWAPGGGSEGGKEVRNGKEGKGESTPLLQTDRRNKQC